MSHNIFPVPAFNDNYIWTIVHPEKHMAVIIDPGQAKPVLDLLEKQNLNVAAILLTHHHWDHINGVEGILQKCPAPVYGPAKSFLPFCNRPVVGGETITIPEAELHFNVLEIPGHTLDHVAYQGHKWIYTGDTLFSGGCGRIFEGSPDQFYNSLQKLASLDPETQIYCGHEYTAKNLKFAEVVEPDNPKLKQRIIETYYKVNQNQPTLPSNIQIELDTNPFLRCNQATIQQRVEEYVGYAITDVLAVFVALRYWKDKF